MSEPITRIDMQRDAKLLANPKINKDKLNADANDLIKIHIKFKKLGAELKKLGY